jgi:hypothetical protein
VSNSHFSLTDDSRPTLSIPEGAQKLAVEALALRLARRKAADERALIPVGFCQCGCGEKTQIAKRTWPDRGYIKGLPVRFIFGHGSKLKPSNPESTRTPRIKVKGQYISAHRVRAELALGKPLPPGSPVHHVDGTKNERSALVICQDRDYHWLLHVRTRIKQAGGNPNTDAICGNCQQVKSRTEFHQSKARRLGLDVLCKPCRAVYQKQFKKKALHAV